MRLLRAFLVLSLLLLPQMANAETLMMATTTSTQDTGLLEYLQPIFKKDTGIDLKWISVGTGKALAFGHRSEMDFRRHGQSPRPRQGLRRRRAARTRPRP